MTDRVERPDRGLPDGDVRIAEQTEQWLERRGRRRSAPAPEMTGTQSVRVSLRRAGTAAPAPPAIADSSECDDRRSFGVAVLGPQLFDQQRHRRRAESDHGLDHLVARVGAPEQAGEGAGNAASRSQPRTTTSVRTA